MNNKIVQGKGVKKQFSDNNLFNESISTNATGLNSNQLNDRFISVARLASTEVSKYSLNSPQSKFTNPNSLSKKELESVAETTQNHPKEGYISDERNKRCRSISPLSRRNKNRAAYLKEKSAFRDNKKSVNPPIKKYPLVKNTIDPAQFMKKRKQSRVSHLGLSNAPL